MMCMIKWGGLVSLWIVDMLVVLIVWWDNKLVIIDKEFEL